MRAIAARMAARSTTAGTPVKSWRTTRPGMNGISVSPTVPARYPEMATTSSSRTAVPSRLRSADSRRTLIEYGR
jgi:hypothetical protein